MILTIILVLLLAIPLYSSKVSALQLTRLTSVTLFFTSFLCFNVTNVDALNSGVSLYSGLYQVDSISGMLDSFLFLLGAFVLLAGNYRDSERTSKAVQSVNRDTVPSIREYPLVLIFSIAGASLLISSSNLVSLYLSVELQSFALYILATLFKDQESATSAGLKYFLIGAMSSALILLGSSVIYASTGLLDFRSITLLHLQAHETGVAETLGVIVMTLGLFIKLSAAPFHQ